MKIEARWQHSTQKPQDPKINHLLVKLKTPPVISAKKRQPLVVVFALDKSWSMKGEKIEAVIEATKTFITWMTRHDYVGVVAYSNDVQVVQPLVQLKEKDSIINKIDTINVGTSTNLSGGWLQALQMAKSSEVKDAIYRVILLTDGLATMGIQDDEQLSKIAKQHYDEGIRTTTIGFGADFNEHSLKEVSIHGGGNFYFVDNPEETSDLFFQEFGNVGSLYAQATELTVTTGPELKIYEVVDKAASQKTKNGATIHVGDMRNDDVRSIIMSVEVDAQETGTTPELKIEASYYNLAEEMQEQKISTQCNLNIDEKISQADDEVEVEILIAWAGKTMIDASAMAGKDVSAAVALLENILNRIRQKKHLSPELLDGLIERVTTVQKRLKTDAGMGRKQLMASGLNIQSNRIKEPMFQNVTMHNDIFELDHVGDLDLYNCPDLRQKVLDQMKKGFRFIVFDMSETGYIDSSAIGTLVQINTWVITRGGKLVVANLTPTVEKVFQITQLTSFIPVAESTTGARMMIEADRDDED